MGLGLPATAGLYFHIVDTETPVFIIRKNRVVFNASPISQDGIEIRKPHDFIGVFWLYKQLIKGNLHTIYDFP